MELQVINPYEDRDSIFVEIAPDGTIDTIVRMVSNPLPNSDGEDAVSWWEEDIEKLNYLFRNSELSTYSMLLLVKEGVFSVDEIYDEQDRQEVMNIILGVRTPKSNFRRVQRT